MDRLAIVPDVVYLAATSDTLPESMRSLCLQTTTILTSTLSHLASLNNDVDFRETPQIRDYLGQNKVVPQRKMSSKEKEALANKLGFHLLSLPGWWRPACVQAPFERANSLLRRQLRHLWRVYWELEAALSVAAAPSQ